MFIKSITIYLNTNLFILGDNNNCERLDYLCLDLAYNVLNNVLPVLYENNDFSEEKAYRH